MLLKLLDGQKSVGKAMGGRLDDIRSPYSRYAFAALHRKGTRAAGTSLPLWEL